MKKQRLFTVVFLVMAMALYAGGNKETGDAAEISARAAIGRLDAADAFYEGDGGKDIRLAVLAPEAQGLGAEEAYLPVYVQGLLNNNFSKYSAITIVDRQNLNQILSEQDIAQNGRFSDADYISISSLTNAQYILAGVIQKVAGNQYAVQLAVTDFKTGVRRASFMRNGSAAQIANGALISEASEALLSQLDVALTDAGRAALTRGQAAAVRAETGYAKGRAAEQSGAAAEALFNYTESIAFDPTKIEALSRFNTVSQEISGGTISAQILNEVEARRTWLGVLKIASAFFNEHLPFEITFDPALMQEGEIDWEREQVNLAMRIALEPSVAGFSALNALVEGLEKTGKREAWGFAGWPIRDITPRTPEAALFKGKETFTFTVQVELVNERGKTIGKGKIDLKSEGVRFEDGEKGVAKPSADWGVVQFSRVKVNDLTPTLNIVIKEVNGKSGSAVSKSGYVSITPGSLEKLFADVRMLAEGFVWVPPGTFQMGSVSRGKSDERPVHQVTISKGFYMSDHEVTQKEWTEIMGTNPNYFKGDNLPVESVSWYEALEYCNKRSVKEGLTPAYSGSGDSITCDFKANGYRLPTEAEWEWAARGGGKDGMIYEYSGSNSVDGVAWYWPSGGNSRTIVGVGVGGAWHWENSRGQTHPVKTKGANSLGLYDMSGNVWEWCWDWYGGYSSGAQTDPAGASSGTNRVRRGGCWVSDDWEVRVAYRDDCSPSYRSDDLGFRLVRP